MRCAPQRTANGAWYGRPNGTPLATAADQVEFRKWRRKNPLMAALPHVRTSAALVNDASDARHRMII
jgi:hypothetical protein